jgi:hypothetical protein
MKIKLTVLSSDRINVNDYFERMWKEAVSYFRTLSTIFRD